LGAEEKDQVLENTLNPVKRVVFTKDKVDDISFTSQDYSTANQKRLANIQAM
jgi:hypothetical protein